MLKAGEAWLETEVPFLNLPVIKQLDETAIEAVADWIFSQVVLLIDIAAIRLVSAAHQSAYEHASIQLAVVAQEKGIDSAEFKQARDKARAALSSFTQLPN